MTPNNIAEIKHWDTVHVDLPGPYIKSTRQQHPDVTTIKNDVSNTCMKMINQDMGWFEIVKVPKFDLDNVKGGNDEYIDE